MITYVDPSVLARAYLRDESGHDEAAALLANTEVALLTGTWSRVEVSGALVRAARAGRGDQQGLLSLLDADLAEDGAVTVVAAAQAEVEREALPLVRRHAIRPMDAWHLANATLILPRLAEAGEEAGFASRDQEQASIAATLGLRLL